MDEAMAGLKASGTTLQNEGYKNDNLDQLSQMARMLEDIYGWKRARTMRLISLYRRAIYLATLSKPENNDAGGRTGDAAVTLPAAKLDAMYLSLDQTLLDLQE
ncbi:hypothetical protein N7491_007976 [Penicillium cf. griseofulvum]|uniref:Uncharacterized protein n=1 Tax=Penicillium cf. griseofulvum TaxID=2972120 RepID=A0A9W9M5U6_9EURO|nr:hypothetical protein N7472_008997 [Penicillium cf. griseofulvum]KAJ5427534.1 hypothetical protein N7491_007976 [Penicillium cf. griseofulvum]